MISIGRKLFKEVDMPLESKIVSEDPINKIAERESTWTAEIDGPLARSDSASFRDRRGDGFPRQTKRGSVSIWRNEFQR